MQIYSLYIHDDRYSVPNLDFINAEDEAGAIAMARDRLASSAHYSAIEIWRNDGFVLTVQIDDPATEGAA